MLVENAEWITALLVARAASQPLAPTATRTTDEVLRLVASLESLSEHPLADAIVRHARDRATTLAPPPPATAPRPT